MDLGDLVDFLDDGFGFTLKGQRYVVKPVTWTVYLELMAMQAHAQAVSDGRAKPEDGPADKPIYQLAPTVLGDVLAELVAAGIDGPSIMLLARAAYLYQIGERDVARVVLASSGKAPAEPIPVPESTSTTPTGSTSSASENETKPPASTTGTRSRRQSKTPSPESTDTTTPVPV